MSRTNPASRLVEPAELASSATARLTWGLLLSIKWLKKIVRGEISVSVLTREVDEPDAGGGHRGGERVYVRVDVGVDWELHDEEGDIEAGSRSTRSLAISTIDTRWPMAGIGTNTSSA
ncbi:hypothetical protein NL676_018933 [Syzygium grande]|nr:hypothetical protein NL676_018933 [Syzygium grande]